MVTVAMGEQNAHPTQGFHTGFRVGYESTVGITITGYLIESNMRVFFCHCAAVIVIITQMDHSVGLCGIYAPTHKAKTCVRI